MIAESEILLTVSSLEVALTQNKEQFALVKNMSFPVFSNETLALVGESGSGKTTTAHALLGLLPIYGHNYLPRTTTSTYVY